MSSNIDTSIEKLQDLLGHRFTCKAFLLEAITHKSHLNEVRKKSLKDNERLEFLGDAVLDLVVRTMLLERYPDEPEGVLSRMKSRLVNEHSLAAVARSIDLGDHILIGKGEELTNGREKNSLLADMLEAIIAAIYLDGNLAAAETFISARFNSLFRQLLRVETVDFKSRIQELIQVEFTTLPTYRLLRQYGPEHQMVFEVMLCIKGISYAIGVGKTKKIAEQAAARITYDKLGACRTLCK